MWWAGPAWCLFECRDSKIQEFPQPLIARGSEETSRRKKTPPAHCLLLPGGPCSLFSASPRASCIPGASPELPLFPRISCIHPPDHPQSLLHLQSILLPPAFLQMFFNRNNLQKTGGIFSERTQLFLVPIPRLIHWIKTFPGRVLSLPLSLLFFFYF